MTDPPAGSRSLRSNRRFIQLWAATGTSALGDGLVFVAFPLLVAASTSDARVTAAVVVAGRLPWLLFGLPAGAIVDRHDHRRVVPAVELCRAALVAMFGVVVVAGHAHLISILGVVFLIGVGETFFLAGTHAALPSIVPRGALAEANGSLFSVQSAMENLLGPALGGALFAAASGLPFLVDAASFAVSGVVLFLAVPSTKPVVDGAASLRRDVRSGLAYFWQIPALRSTAAVIGVLSFCQSMIFAVLVLFAKEELGLTAVGFGLLVTVAAIGHVLGGVLAGRVDRRFGSPTVILVGSVLVAVCYLVAGLSSRPVVGGAAFAVEGAMVAVSDVAIVSFRQRIVPAQLLGRVGNIYRVFIYGVVPPGALAGGFLAHATNLRVPFVVAAGVDLVAIAALGPSLARRIRRELAGCDAM